MATTNNLERFIAAQKDDYATALAEISQGRKRSHWMWYIFPQIQGLGFSGTAQFYAIKDLEEAGYYLAHPVLGARLTAICEALLQQKSNNATEIFGNPDDLKLRSSLTLFAQVQGAPLIFKQVLARFFDGQEDAKTLNILGAQNYN
jgi:uncharacterized protein (DUF1810 family)